MPEREQLYRHSDGRSSLFCECENCTDRWSEDRDGIGAIRCPSCGSKNVDIYDPEDASDEPPRAYA